MDKNPISREFNLFSSKSPKSFPCANIPPKSILRKMAKPQAKQHTKKKGTTEDNPQQTENIYRERHFKNTRTTATKKKRDPKKSWWRKKRLYIFQIINWDAPQYIHQEKKTQKKIDVCAPQQENHQGRSNELAEELKMPKIVSWASYSTTKVATLLLILRWYLSSPKKLERCIGMPLILFSLFLLHNPPIISFFMETWTITLMPCWKPDAESTTQLKYPKCCWRQWHGHTACICTQTNIAATAQILDIDQQNFYRLHCRSFAYDHRCTNKKKTRQPP